MKLNNKHGRCSVIDFSLQNLIKQQCNYTMLRNICLIIVFYQNKCLKLQDILFQVLGVTCLHIGAYPYHMLYLESQCWTSDRNFENPSEIVFFFVFFFYLFIVYFEIKCSAFRFIGHCICNCPLAFVKDLLSKLNLFCVNSLRYTDSRQKPTTDTQK